jgi:hypothetical protein
MVERGGQGTARSSALVFCDVDHHVRHRQLDRVFLEAVQPWARPQRSGTRRPPASGCGRAPSAHLRQVGVDALAVERPAAPASPTCWPRKPPLPGSRSSCAAMLSGRLRASPQRCRSHSAGKPSFTYSRRRKCHTSVVVPTVLLRPPRDKPLLDRHRGRDAEHRVHLGPPGGLHDAARVGVQAFQVAPLPFVEQDVEGQRALARARSRQSPR